MVDCVVCGKRVYGKKGELLCKKCWPEYEYKDETGKIINITKEALKKIK